MNPDRKNLGDEASKINEESSSYESIDKDTIDCANSSTIESTEVYPKNNTTANTNQSLTPSSPGSISEAAATLSPEMKRSAVKELIERYFYQLQRGCGNPKCNNKYCASSGEVEQMTPNQIAARAIQLFGMDAKLCDSYNQPSKVPRTQELIPTSSSYSSNYSSGKMAPLPCASPVGQDNGILLPNDNFTGSSNSSSSSTSLSGSHSSTPTTSGTSSSSNKNISNHTRNFIQQPTTAATTTAQLLLTSHPTSNCTELPLATTSSNNPVLPVLPQYLDEKIIDELIEKSKQEENPNYETLINLLGDVFSNYEKLGKSFRKNQNTKSERSSNATTSRENLLLKEKPTDLSNLKKEDLRTLEGETDKDEDSTVFDQDTSEMQDNDLSLPLKAPTNLSDTNVDFQSLRRSIRKIYDLHLETISDTINIAIGEFSGAINVNMRYKSEAESEAYMHGFVICFDLTTCAELDYLESALPKLCHAARRLCVSHHARLAHIWAVHCKDHLRTLVQSFQQIITLEVITDDEYVQESLYITAVTRVLKIAFYANIIAGQMELSKSAPITDVSMSESSGGSSGAAGAPLEEDDFFFYSQISKSSSKFPDDKLEIELGVSAMDCRVPLIPFEEFYNDALSEVIQMDRDYLNYKNLLIDPNGDEELNFTFMRYSFILSPTTKVIALYYDSRIRMFSERSSSLYTLVNFFGDEHEPGMRPDFKLKVRRDNIIDDALVGLEMVAMSNPKDFKKQLVVEFVGEQGIDEGGVSKEFFQLIIEELFNPDFGMFTYQEDTKIVWFNSMPFENEAQFTLIGIILGLAIYNHVILAVNFPMVVYRKLMGGRGSFYDLEDWNPTLYRSLKSLLDYEGDDMEECFMQTFKIGYNDVYGQAVEYELKPGGGDITVGQHNKQEFVDLYSDYLLNKNIDRQFRAFKKGFDMVTDESPLKLLFRPEEIELLVCGSKKFDFVELEKSTDYEGGYTRESRVIADFWNIVHALPDELKRKLLEFTTGSDRVPVGGLSRLKLLITRHGPDSDRLPTSHTCFNVLLLPEYSSREKLEERLLKAINYSKGFGML